MLLDTKGPEIRTKELLEPVFLEKGEEFLLTTLKHEGKITTKNRKMIVSDYEEIIDDVKAGKTIDIDSGLLGALVRKKINDALVCVALNSHLIGSRRHINLPGVKLSLPALTDKDKEDILFAIKHEFDFLALSFIRTAVNLVEVKAFLKKHKGDNLELIAKIENEEAVKNIDEIIDASDGVMIARGDLGIEVPMERIPVIQKMITDRCKEQGKICIVATQLLESMLTSPIPTRAEVTDIFNAVLGKVDATMLSGETAAGRYPVESVERMTKIIKYSEKNISNRHDYCIRDFGNNNDRKNLVRNAIEMADDIKATALVLFTKSGFMGKLAATHRPNKPVYAFTFTEAVVRKLNIAFGIKPILTEQKSITANIKDAFKYLQKKKLVQAGDKIIIVSDVSETGEYKPYIQIREVR